MCPPCCQSFHDLQQRRWTANWPVVSNKNSQFQRKQYSCCYIPLKTRPGSNLMIRQDKYQILTCRMSFVIQRCPCVVLRYCPKVRWSQFDIEQYYSGLIDIWESIVKTRPSSKKLLQDLTPWSCPFRWSVNPLQNIDGSNKAGTAEKK